MSAQLSLPELVGVVIALLFIASATQVFSKWSRLPFTVLLVLVGIALSQLAQNGPVAFQSTLHPFAHFQLSSELILLVLLPTLVFESAFNLDSRQLKQNLFPILALAIPGVLLSTFILGGLISLLTPLEFSTALILGAILSATDPVAVIALFKQLGAPERLTIIVEGESLFNDATAIVLTRILIAIALSGVFTANEVLSGTLNFLGVFLGGILVGWLAARIFGWLLSKVESDPLIEIQLTIVLAYASFLLAEELFHVSGVMAAVAAGITMGGWGRTKISPSVSEQLSQLWEYFAYVANALIFLLVGLQVNLIALGGALDILLWVIVGMLLSRAAVVYGLLPIVRWMKQTTAISRGYQVVLYWGGLRGAVALALVMSLPEPLYNETLVALVTGAVLFTLLVQGLTIEPLVKKLGLNEPPLEDRLSKLEGTLEAVRNAAKRIPELKSGGLFSARIAGQLEQEYQQAIDKTYQQLQDLRKDQLSSETERRLLYIHCFATEKVIYYRLFSKGHLSEEVYLDLAHSLTLQTDSMRHQSQVPAYTLHSKTWQILERKLLIWFSRLPGFAKLAEVKRMRYTARTYEKNWGLYQGGRKVLRELREFKRLDPKRSTIDEVAQSYQRWHDNAQQRLDAAAEQLPEFVTAMQTRLAHRTLLQSQKEDLQAQAEAGFVPEHVACELIAQLQNPLRSLRGYESQALRLDPQELLHQVPLFQTLSHEELGHLAKQLRNLTLPPGEIIIHKGETGSSMFLIGRGVVRIVRESTEPEQEGREHQLATLLAGDFFGEMALLHKTPRNATCRSITPCVIYELQRDAFEQLIQQYPILQEKVEQVAQARK